MMTRPSAPQHTAPARRWAWLLLALLLPLLAANVGWWRSTATGPQVQVPMFYDAHYLFQRPWTQQQAAPGVPPPAPLAFYGPNRVSQPFVVQADRLALIGVWLAGPVGTAVDVTVAGADQTVGGTLVLDDAAGRFYRLRLPPLASAKGMPLTVTLHAPSASAESPVVTQTVGGDRVGGSLKLNEFSRPGNLVLASYSAGPVGRWWLDAVGEQMLPALFQLRLQQYKPAPLKGNAFGWLLASTVVLTLVALVLAWPQGRRVAGLRWLLLGGSVAFLLWQAGSGRWLLPGLTETIGLDSAESPRALSPPPGTPRLSHDLAQQLWTGQRAPEPFLVEAASVDGRATIRVPAQSAITFALQLPFDAQMRVGTTSAAPLRFRVLWNDAPLWEAVGAASATIDLRAYGGESGTLRLLTEPVDGDVIGGGQWLMPQISTTAPWLSASSTAATPVNARFNDAVVLLGATRDGADLTLYWQALRPTDANPTVFVHVLDADGALLLTADRLPLFGTYPVSAWQPGDVIVDRYVIPELADDGTQLAVGLYDGATLVRWTAVSAETNARFPNDAVPVKDTATDE